MPDAALVPIFSEHGRALERIAASYARSDADREELLQDFAIAIWRALPAFRAECTMKTFVLRIAHHRALTFLSKRHPTEEDIDDHAGSVVATSGKNPAVAYERKERQQRLLAAVRGLPLGHRRVVTLLLEGLSHREIADVLGTSENNVAVRANRARAAMRALLGEDDARGLR
jgi:RNA polymerase sigma-70 factor (ECF subfamily)